MTVRSIETALGRDVGPVSVLLPGQFHLDGRSR